MALTQAVVPDLSPSARQFVEGMMQSMMQGGMHGGMAMTDMAHSGSMGAVAPRPAEPPKKKPWWQFW